MASFIGRAQHSAAVLRSPNISLSKKVGGTTRPLSFSNHQMQRGQNDELKASSSFAKVGVVSGATSSFEWSGANPAAQQEDHNGDDDAFAKRRQQDKSKLKADFIGKTLKLDGAHFISPHQPMEVSGPQSFAKDWLKRISSRNFSTTKAADELPIEG